MDTCPLTVIILARNESAHIADCIRTCGFATEILLIDDGSTDNTVSIAQELGARVLHHAMDGDWGAQQNYGIANATQPWILFLDADERVSPELGGQIRAKVNADERHGYWMQRENHFSRISVTHGTMRPDWVLRLMPREGARVEGRVHPTVISPHPSAQLKGRLLHYSYRDWDQYFAKFEQYTRLAALKAHEQGRTCSFVRDIMLRPLWAFLKIYILNRGFLDGRYGFIFSVNHMFYTFVKYIRLYQLIRFGGKF